MTYLPWGWCTLLAVLLAAVVWRRHPLSRAALAIAVAGLLLWSWWPFTALFAASLERWYPLTPFPARQADAMVVLSAGAYAADASQPEPLPENHLYLRCAHAVWLFRHWRQVPIIVSGGLVNGVVMAELMKRDMVAEGIPAAMIWQEGSSESTYQNAAYTAAILRRAGMRRVAVVTEAYHMPRAMLCFRKQGLDPVPAPCSAECLRFHWKWDQLVPSPAAMTVNENTLHEWCGLLWYRISGKI